MPSKYSSRSTSSSSLPGNLTFRASGLGPAAPPDSRYPIASSSVAPCLSFPVNASTSRWNATGQLRLLCPTSPQQLQRRGAFLSSFLPSGSCEVLRHCSSAGTLPRPSAARPESCCVRPLNNSACCRDACSDRPDPGAPSFAPPRPGGGRERTRSLRILRCLALRGLRENTGVGVGGAMLGSDVLGSSSSPAFPGSLAAPHDTRILRWVSAFSEGAAPRRVVPGRPSHRALEPTAASAPPLCHTVGTSRPAPPRGGEARQACAILHCRSRPYRRIRNGGSRRPPTHRKKTNSSRWKFGAAPVLGARADL